MEGTRTVWRDNAKAIGIALVVFGHALRGLMAANLIDTRVWHPVDFAVYTFHMPVFMFLAGVSVPQSLGKGVPRFIRSKVLTVAYPYFVWSFIQFAVMFALASVLSGAHAHDQLLDFFWRPISPYWFLYALFVFLVITALVGWRTAVWIAVIAFPFGELLDKDTIGHQLLHFALFFAVGMIASNRGRLVIDRFAALAGLGVAAVTVGIALDRGFTNYNSVLMAPAAFGAGLFVIWLSQQIAAGWLAGMGRLSFAIYVMHVLATAGVIIVMNRFAHVPPIAAVYVTIDTAAGIALPIVAWQVMRRLGLLPWFGLATGPRGQAWIAQAAPAG